MLRLLRVSLPSCAVFVLALLAGPGRTEDEPTGKGKSLLTGTQYTCPIYLWADYGTYQSWYADQCPSTYVNLNTPEGWMAAQCPQPCQPVSSYCIATGSLLERRSAYPPERAKLLDKGGHHHPDLEKGIKKGKPLDNPIPKASQKFSTLKKKSLVTLVTNPDTTPPTKVKVALYRVTVTPPKAGLPEKTFNTGIEVDTIDPAKPEIGYGSILETYGKVLTLKIEEGTGATKETVIYEVVVDKDTSVKPKK